MHCICHGACGVDQRLIRARQNRTRRARTHDLLRMPMFGEMQTLEFAWKFMIEERSSPIVLRTRWTPCNHSWRPWGD